SPRNPPTTKSSARSPRERAVNVLRLALSPGGSYIMGPMTAQVETVTAGGVSPLAVPPPVSGNARPKHIMGQTDLVARVKAYDPDADERLLNQAYTYSQTAHGEQLRASGDPYFAHPLEVAAILTDLKLDVPTIVTALLHDTIEDTHVTYEDVEQRFGKEIAELVDGVNKISILVLFF